jgi:hypothetical protein
VVIRARKDRGCPLAASFHYAGTPAVAYEVSGMAVPLTPVLAGLPRPPVQNEQAAGGLPVRLAAGLQNAAWAASSANVSFVLPSVAWQSPQCAPASAGVQEELSHMRLAPLWAVGAVGPARH